MVVQVCFDDYLLFHYKLVGILQILSLGEQYLLVSIWTFLIKVLCYPSMKVFSSIIKGFDRVKFIHADHCPNKLFYNSI